MIFRKISFGIVGVFVCSVAQAFQFQATDAEWAAWPEYCKARYATVRVGKSLGFDRRISPGEIERWQAIVGPDAWYGLHHMCAGMSFMDRAKAESNPSKRDSLVKSAMSNYGYMLRHTPPSDPFHAETLTRIGLAYEQTGDRNAAQSHFAQAIAANPAYPGGYLGQYKLYRDRGETRKAREILEQGDSATGGTSAEIKYFLGLVSLELGDKHAAVDYARDAYSLGYQLPALRDRLAKAGLSL